MNELYYREACGSMARFEALRPEHLQSAGSDFTYRMLRTPFAARLPLIAGHLLKEDFLAFLEMEGVK